MTTETRPFGTCTGCLGPQDSPSYTVCMECTKARCRTATTRGGCKCGRKARPTEVKRVGSRTWISCHRCLGQIKQLS